MSRDLKNEYVAMLDHEIPDLWSRIEPRLAEKRGVQDSEAWAAKAQDVRQKAGVQEAQAQDVRQKAGVQEAEAQDVRQKAGMQEAQGVRQKPGVQEEQGVQEAKAQDVRQKPGVQEAEAQDVQAVRIQKARGQQDKRARRRPRRSTIAVWGSLAAAGVCLAVILPAWRANEKGFHGTNQMSEPDYLANDPTAAAEWAQDDVQQSKDGMIDRMEPEDNGAYNNSAEDYDYAAESDGGMSGALNGEEAAREEEAEIAEDMAALENATAQSPQEDDESGADTAIETEAGKPEEGTELISAYECSGEIVDAWQTREGFFYRMELTESVGDFMPAGSELVLLQKTGLLAGMMGTQDAVLTSGNRYRVVVEPEEADGEMRYVLISYEAEDSE